jgi:hypothetical protein
MMASAFLPHATSTYQGNDLGIVSARPEDVPPLPLQAVLDFRRWMRTLYPRNDGPGHGFSSANPKRFPAPMVTGPFGSRAAQLQMGWSPHSISTGLGRMRAEYPDLFCTGQLASVPSGNRHVAVATRTTPSATGGVDVLLGVFNWKPSDEMTFPVLPQYPGWQATAIHPQLGGGEMSDPRRIGSGGQFALTLGPYDARYYLLDPSRQTSTTA